MAGLKLIRVAVVGAGHWGPNLSRNFHNHTTSEVAWVIDRYEARLKLAESRYPGIRIATDPAAAFADPEVDAVVISNPTTTHYELASAALEAGKHALVEKPVAASAAEADALCDLAEQRGLILMVGQVFLFNAAIRRVKEYLAQGALGRLFYISMVRTNLGPIRMDVNAAWDLAAHDIAIANDWLGAIPLQAAAQGAPGSTTASRTPSSPTSGIRRESWSTSTFPGSARERSETSRSWAKREY